MLLRADGSPKIGLGHLYRVWALAEMLKDKYHCVLVTSFVDDLIASEATRLGIPILKVASFNYSSPNDKRDSEEIPFDMNNFIERSDTVVIDGYWFGIKYQSAVKERGCRLVCIDDLAVGEFNADVIINHAPGIKAPQYRVGSQTKLCLGLDYLILRPAFFKTRIQRAKLPKSVYLSFGGSDSHGLSLKFISLFLTTGHQMAVHLLLSSSFNKDLISKLSELQKAHKDRVFLHQNLSGEEISNLIDKCTHAVTGSSTVALEVVARGIKPLIGYYADNQKGIYNGLVEKELALGAGSFLTEETFPLKAYIELDTSLSVELNNDKLMTLFG